MDRTQKGVAIRVAIAALAGIFGLLLGATLTPHALGQTVTLHSRLSVAVVATLSPAITLFVCIARLANHRFFTPEDINGSALTSGSERARLLQALLQNTLEQATLAISVYFCSAIAFPSAFLGAIVAGGAMFLIGRIAFFAGYKNGAPSRAFGFAVTFYPTVLLLVGTAYFVIVRSAGS